ncbi:hypothetical protein CY34DRAFT_31498, partial [Suillus luteus UH-Slu-Lm8-n1]
LDWVGKSSEFNSCLPADITSYQVPPWLPSLSEDDIQTSVSSLQDSVVIEMTSGLYPELGSLSAARFAHRRLHLPCIAFLVTEVRGRPGQDKGAKFMYQVKAKGLHDLLITTEDRLIQFWPGRPALQTFYLVRPWNQKGTVDSESHSRALRLLVRLGQSFGAFLLAQQRGGEYKRIASDHVIVAQVKDIAFVRDIDVRTLEIL